MSLDDEIGRQWQHVRDRLREEVGEASFRSWVRPLTLDSVEDGEVRIAAPSNFMRDWVANHYRDKLMLLWAMENGAIRSVEIVVAPDAAAFEAGPLDVASSDAAGPVRRRAALDMDGMTVSRSAAIARPPEGAGHTGANGAAPDSGGPPDDVDTLSLIQGPLDPRFTFEAFVVGKPNEFAHAAARRVAEGQAVSFNPLFLYGGVGLGKTHLMHAIAWHLRRARPDRRVLYLSAEKFMYQFIRALRFKDTMNFKQMFRSVDVLMIDDVQFISGKEATQEEFFHTFNALVDENRQVVVSADKSPTQLDIEDRLKSRLGWGLVADIHPTNYELRLGILHAKAEKLPVQAPDKVLEFLAHRLSANVRELEGALNRLAAHAELVGRPITLDSTQELLADVLRASDRRVTIDEIQKAVAGHFHIKVSDMHSARRARAVARPRQVAMWLAKQLTPRSLPEIGRKFGGRDHTTVMHAVRRIDELSATDASFAEDLELLRRMLEG
ncbi:MAG: chromosomal replication initiator protein DnaA [Rhodospirillaceae bacterium]|nr:chromosomal replication initiator protein DnaA [Rhodospirillaceae bacterium]